MVIRDPEAIRPPVRAWVRLLPALIVGALFGAVGWRGAPGSGPWYPDASRHVLNGALIHDMIADGGWTRPVAYAREYYAHLPALSLGYHPPGFPLVEAVWFSITGVDYSAARLLVAISVCLSCVLFYGLLLRTHASSLMASSIVVGFMLTPVALYTSREVLLEFPSLVPALLAMHALLSWDSAGNNARIRPAVAYGFWSAAAICTRQHWILLVPLPALLVIVRRRWCDLRDWSLLLMAVFGIASFAGTLALARLAGSSNTGWRKWPLHEIVLHHLRFYSDAVVKDTGLVGALVCAALIAALAYRRWRTSSDLPSDLYLAWLASAGALLLLLRPWDSRYLFHLWPALLVLALGGVTALPRRLGLLHGLIFVASFAIAVFPPRLPRNLYGQEEAARQALAIRPKRILYCGPNPGTFVYAVRRAQGWPQTAVIRADQLPGDVLSSAQALRQFSWDYGIESLAIEAGARCPEVNPQHWDALHVLGTIPVTGGEAKDGRILVFENRSISPTPKTRLSLNSTLVPGGLQVDY